MAISSTEEVKTDDLKAQLEAIAGHEIDANAEQLAERILKLDVAVSSYAFTLRDGDGIGHVVTKNIIIARPPVCTTPRLLDISVVGATSSTGNTVFSINNYVCPTELTLVYDEPVNVVATAIAAKPVFLTATYALVHTPPTQFATDLRVTVFAWDANGAPAPNVTVHLRCRVPADVLIL